MTGFALAAIFISICCILLLLVPLVRTPASRSIKRTAQNIHYAKQRLGELNQQLDNDSITAEDYESLKQEIESTLAKDIELQNSGEEQVQAESGQANGVVIALICTLIPFGALSLYLLTGTPEAIAPREAAPSPPAGRDIDSMVASLENRLQQQPNDVEGWTILARTYLSLGRYRESIVANERLIEIGGEDANVYAQMADAAALLAEGNLAGQPTEYVQKALQLNPEQPQALWLAGLSAAQQGRDAEARSYWNKLLPLLAGAPQQQQELREIIQQTLSSGAARAADSTRSDQAGSSPSAPPPTTPQSGIRIRVQIADALKEQALPNETVFVFARAQSGPAAPLAVKPLRVSDLPIEIVLSDADGMIPQLKLSAFKDIVVSARIAKSGNPVAQAGDFQSALVSTTNDHADLIELTITDIVE